MKLKYLGTAAAEGFPALFCNCKYCNEARRLGGKNIRTRSQTFINDDMLIDFPADAYMHILQHGIRGDEIKYLLITHAHSDHFNPKDLYMRGGPYAHDMPVERLRVLCPSTVYNAFDKMPDGVDLKMGEPYRTVELGRYKVTPLPARHMLEAQAFIYIVEEGDKALLYAHDTGYFYDEVFDYISRRGLVFDMVSLDCTNMDIPVGDNESHMGFPNISRVLDRLANIGAVKESTLKYVNHFSHNGNPIHHVLEARAKEIGCQVSYDGCEVEI